MSAKAATEDLILDGRVSRPWEFQRWLKDVESAFTAKDLHKYFTGAIPSSLYEEEPEFGYVLEETVYTDPDATSEISTVLFETPKKDRSGDKSGAPSSVDKNKLIAETVCGSPGTELFRLARRKVLTHDQDFYWKRVDAHQKKVDQLTKLRDNHSSKINDCLEILRKKTTASLQRSMRTTFDSRDIPKIVHAIKLTCGPTSRIEGIGLLDDKWANVRLQPKMTIEELTQTVEDLSNDFEVFQKYKEDAEKRLVVEKALIIAYRDYDSKWGPTFRDLELVNASWERTKMELHARRNKLLAQDAYRETHSAITAAPAADEGKAAKEAAAKKKKKADEETAAAKKAKDTADKEAADKDQKRKAAAAERIKTADCWNCGEKGHLKKDCPKAKKEPEQTAALCITCEEAEWTCDPDEVMVPLTSEVVQEEQCVVVANARIHLMDSGTMSHCNNDQVNPLEDFQEGDERISLGKKSNKVPALGRGTWGLRKRVMWAPQMSYSLTSTSQLDMDGYYSVFGGGECMVFDPEAAEEMKMVCERLSDRVRMRAELRGGLYHVDEEFEGLESVAGVAVDKKHAEKKEKGEKAKTNGESSELAKLKEIADDSAPYTFNKNARLVSGRFGTIREGSNGDLNDLERLHLRCAHVSRKVLLQGLKNNAFEGAQTTYAKCKDLTMRPCEACWLGKMRAQHVPQSQTAVPLAPMEEVSIDPVPLSTLTVDGNDVINFGIDYATGYVFTYESKGEGNQKEVVQKIIRDLCVPHGHKLKKVHTDFAKIFLAKEFQKFLIAEGIGFESSPPYQHQFNRVEGCCVKPLEESARVLLADSGLPPRFAGYAVRAAEDAHNATLHGGAVVTPFEALTGKKPDLSRMRQFGQVAYCFLSPQERLQASDPRWKEKAMKGILLGNSREVPGGYYIYPGNNRKIVTRGGGQVVVMEGRETDMLPTFTDRFRIEDEIFLQREGNNVKIADNDGVQKPKQKRNKDPDDVPVTRMSVRLEERRRKVSEGTEKTCVCCSEEICAAVMTPSNPSTLPKIPRSIAEAERLPEAQQWIAALKRERDVMLDSIKPKYEAYNGRPKRFMRAVLAFRVKVLDDSSLQFKTRICPDGSTQQQGVDFEEKYSPTVSRELILLALHIIATKNWPAKQFDVGSAYLEVPAQHEQYMRLTPDMVRLGFAPTEFVKLLANFYGNPDAGRHWYKHFTALLLEFGMKQSVEAACLFTISTGVGENMLILVVLLVVDDGLYAGNWTAKSDELEQFLRERLEKIKINALTKFVGMQICREPAKREVYVSSTDYDRQVVEKYTTQPSVSHTAVDTPLYTSVEYRGVEGTEKPIRGVVGSVNFSAGIAWPDLRVPVSLLSSAGDKPHANHTKGAKRVLQYMRDHLEGRKLVLGGEEPVRLMAYTDASYSPEGDSLYQYGFALMLSTTAGAFSVVSKRSKTVSHSSLQSEVKALDEACKEIESMRRVLGEFGCAQDGPTPVYTDSQSAIDLVKNYFGYHPKCRHFNRDINYLRQCVDLGLVELYKVHTDDNAADLLTKLCSGDKTTKFTTALLSGVRRAVKEG